MQSAFAGGANRFFLGAMPAPKWCAALFLLALVDSTSACGGTTDVGTPDAGTAASGSGSTPASSSGGTSGSSSSGSGGSSSSGSATSSSSSSGTSSGSASSSGASSSSGSAASGDASTDAGGSADAGVRADVAALMEKVADWQIRQLGGSAAKTWIEATFYAGLMATYRTTHQAKYLDAVDAWGKANQWTLGPGRTNADDQCAGQAYVEAYDVDNNMAELNPTQTELGAMVAAPQAGRVVWWWADALFMSPPVFARVGAATSQSKYFDAMNTMYWDTVAFLQDKASGLFWRDGTFFGRTCPNGKPMFWARGNAWVIAGAARVIDELPPAYPDRPKFIALLRTMATALLPLQRSDGYWSSCLTDAKDYPSPETSGTAGFTFALAWGVNRGLLDAATYGPAIAKGWSALAAAVNATSGQLGWVQPVGGAPGPSALGNSAPYGTGLFLLAGSEVATLAP